MCNVNSKPYNFWFESYDKIKVFQIKEGLTWRSRSQGGDGEFIV